MGFVIASTPTTSYLLTAAHVLGCAETERVGCRDTVKVRFVGQFSTVTGTTVLAAKSPDGTDLALVKADLGNKAPVPILSDVVTDQDLFVIGFSSAIIQAGDQFGGRPEAHDGNISRIDPSRNFIEVNVPAYPGFSGGPVVDKSTHSIIGVFTGHLRPEEQTTIDYQGVGPARVLEFLTAAKAKASFDFQEISDEENEQTPDVTARNESALTVPPPVARPLVAASAAASPVDAPSANPGGSVASSAQSLLVLAQQGNPRVEYALSQAYLGGAGVDVDVQAALRWLQKSAAAHYPPALTALGLVYAQGEYVARDQARALALLQSAANAGEPLAQLNLGNVYRFGKLGATPDANLSKAWYAKAFAGLMAASQAGDADATWRLGNLSLSGIGRDAPDINMGLSLLSRASDLGSPKASTSLGSMYLHAQFVPQDIARGLDYLRKSEREGGADATALLAQIYLEGLFGQRRDPQLGLRYLQEAADRGRPWAICKLGVANLDGGLDGGVVSKDLVAAGELFKKSSDLGYLRAQTDYALWLLENGPPADRNVAQGLDVLHDAADRKHFARAMDILGELYRDGKFVPRNAVTAFNYFQESARRGGGAVVYFDLAQAYELGQGTPVNPALAKYWYLRSANLKYAPASTKLAALGQS